MPTREQIAANKITDEHLQPHLRKRRGGGGKTVISTTTTTVNSLQWQGVAAVDIASNKLVSIDVNNQYILADAVLGTPAIGIAKDGGFTGETITIIDDAIISNAITANVGDDLWLSNTGGISASTPTEPLQANTILQKIGFVVDTNRIRIKINNPFYIE